MKKYIGVLLITTVMLPTAAAAQEKPTFVEARGSVKPVPLPPGGPTPRLPDGKPDFSGVWFEGPTGKANAWSVDREQGPPGPDPVATLGRRETQRDDPGGSRVEQCLGQLHARGSPGMFTENAFAHQIMMKPGLMIHLVEMNNRWHVIHTDGRPHKPQEELEPLFYGDQTARWEGDMLVIDSISIDTRAQIRDGWFHSDALHVIERLRRPSANYLEYQLTIEDPKVLTKPWTSPWNTFTLSANNEDLTENFCTNNENVSSSGNCMKPRNPSPRIVTTEMGGHNVMTRVARAFSIVALVVLFNAPAWAQATAELNGRVTDSSGAVLPGVTVTATQTATGLVRTVVTDGDGNYLVSNLPTGPIALRSRSRGSRATCRPGLC